MTTEHTLSRLEQIDNRLKEIARGDATGSSKIDSSKEVFRLSMERVALMKPKIARVRNRNVSFMRFSKIA
jgi:hypothetical protein